MREPEPHRFNGELSCEDAWSPEDDWMSLRDARSLWLPGASIEGTRSEMRGLAEAVLARGRFNGENRRCAVDAARADGNVVLWSPRNSVRPVLVAYATAERWARAFLAVAE